MKKRRFVADVYDKHKGLIASISVDGGTAYITQPITLTTPDGDEVTFTLNNLYVKVRRA